MEDKFIRVVSPFTLAVSLVLDFACVFLCYTAVISIGNRMDFWQIAFYIIDIISVILVVLYNKETFSNGVKFSEECIEFVGIDDDNVFEYSHIVKVETYKDTKASFKKSFTDRFSLLILTLDDGTQVTVSLGYTTKKTLDKILPQLNSRINKA